MASDYSPGRYQQKYELSILGAMLPQGSALIKLALPVTSPTIPMEYFMKNITILIRAELEVPDEWQLTDHASGMQVLKIGDQFVDFDITPLSTTSNTPDAEWSDQDEALVNTVLDTVVGIDVELESGNSQ